MKEQLFEILHNRKRMPGERFSDIEGKIENFVNQEVERRIRERMPSEEEIDSAAYHYGQFPDFDGVMIHDGEAQVTFAEGAEWFRSRLTNTGDSQKKKGVGK